MTDLELNLSAAPYAHSMATAFRKDGTAVDLEVLSVAVLDAVDEWLEAEFGDRYSDEACAAFRDWCKRNSVYYYGAPKEDFLFVKGVDAAAEARCTYFLADNLS